MVLFSPGRAAGGPPTPRFCAARVGGVTAAQKRVGVGAPAEKLSANDSNLPKIHRREGRSCPAANFSTLANCNWRRGAAGNGPGATIKYLRRTTSAAAGYVLGTTAKYLLGATGVGLGTTIKYLRRTTSAAAGQRPWHHDQLPATHSERRCGLRSGQHDQVTATHNERRLGLRTWRHDQVPA